MRFPRRAPFAMVSCSNRCTFAYPGIERPVLDRLDLRIEPGERIALIGENGQGKTTIVKLLTRLYDPTAGRILLDGVDLRDYSIEDLHSQIGVIFQDFMRYEMSARQNIAVGRIDASDDGAIEQAAHKSLADRGHREASQRLRAIAWPALRRRGGSFGRRVAESRAGARLSARRATADSRRAHRLAGRALRIRCVSALRGIDRRQNGAADLAPLFHCSHGGPHRGSRKTAGSPKRAATPSWSRWGRYADMFEMQAASYR